MSSTSSINHSGIIGVTEVVKTDEESEEDLEECYSDDFDEYESDMHLVAVPYQEEIAVQAETVLFSSHEQSKKSLPSQSQTGETTKVQSRIQSAKPILSRVLTRPPSALKLIQDEPSRSKVQSRSQSRAQSRAESRAESRAQSRAQSRAPSRKPSLSASIAVSRAESLEDSDSSAYEDDETEEQLFQSREDTYIAELQWQADIKKNANQVVSELKTELAALKAQYEKIEELKLQVHEKNKAKPKTRSKAQHADPLEIAFKNQLATIKKAQKKVGTQLTKCYFIMPTIMRDASFIVSSVQLLEVHKARDNTIKEKEYELFDLFFLKKVYTIHDKKYIDRCIYRVLKPDRYEEAKEYVKKHQFVYYDTLERAKQAFLGDERNQWLENKHKTEYIVPASIDQYTDPKYEDETVSAEIIDGTYVNRIAAWVYIVRKGIQIGSIYHIVSSSYYIGLDDVIGQKKAQLACWREQINKAELQESNYRTVSPLRVLLDRMPSKEKHK